MESTRRLANVRIHVERVIGSARQKFQTLSVTTPLPTQYTRSKDGGPILLDSIVRVCCALHNACEIIVPVAWMVSVTHTEANVFSHACIPFILSVQMYNYQDGPSTPITCIPLTTTSCMPSRNFSSTSLQQKVNKITWTIIITRAQSVRHNRYNWIQKWQTEHLAIYHLSLWCHTQNTAVSISVICWSVARMAETPW